MLVQRAQRNASGDGAGNYQRGWEAYVGPIFCDFEMMSPERPEGLVQGQVQARARWRIGLRRNPLTALIDNKDRIIRKPRGEIFNVTSVDQDETKPIMYIYAEAAAA